VADDAELYPVADDAELSPVADDAELYPVADDAELSPVADDAELYPVADDADLSPVECLDVFLVYFRSNINLIDAPIRSGKKIDAPIFISEHATLLSSSCLDISPPTSTIWNTLVPGL
jgi:hypothetical protein